MNDATNLPGPDDVHRFWFGALDDREPDWAAVARRNNARWYAHGKDLDPVVREHFAALVEAAAQGRCDHWLEAPASALALVIVLDQFPRHLHRGSGAAFALDARARAACEAGIERGHDRALSPVERSFFYLPLEHSEDPAAQQRCVALMEQAAADAGDGLADFMKEAVHYARLHRDIIARFGRFPHRNAVLGRAPTDAEAAWLEEGGARFGQ